jgi:beta-barrel assembly-enhancing protease
MLQTTSFLPAALLLVSLTASAQTPVTPPNNKYQPAEDVKIGRETAAEVRKQLPMLNERAVTSLVDQIGRRLVNNIPSNMRHQGFRYTFEVVNMREINAFALPGGPMFLHRGMIEAAKSDAEVAGVMAHELAHVVLRHGTAQATKAQPFQIGAIAGQILGAIVGGREGQVIAQGSEIGLGTWFMKYGREYERQADLLGAQIMARAGYDPRQMANMFRTIQAQGGGRGPEWLSSHPDPGNRYAAINDEAAKLSIGSRANTASAFQSARSRLAQLPQAPTAEQVAKGQPQAQGQGTGGPVGTTGRTARVEGPSNTWRTHQPADFLRISVPGNWREVGGGNAITYAPEGGAFQTQGGGSAFTHGVQVGVIQASGGNLQQATEQIVEGFRQSNPQLQRQGGYSRATIGGRQGLVATLTNRSEVTGEQEVVNLSTVQVDDGAILYLVGVAPSSEARAYANTFARIRQSVQIGR